MDDILKQPNTRRDFLAGIGAAGAATLLGEARAQSNSGTGQNPRRIDFHHHYQPPEVLAFAASKKKNNGPASWDLAKDLDDMDKNGTATALLSFQIPAFLEFGDRESTRKVARMCNDYAAKLRAGHPGRFGIFAALPMWYGDVEGTHKEIEYTLDTLKADGFGIYTDYGDIWLGDASLAPVWEELNLRKALVYVHPKPANCCGGLIRGVPDTVVEYGEDTTRTIASLLFSGTTRRFPDITWVFSHSGGMMPFIIERFFQGGMSAEIIPGIVTKGQSGAPVKAFRTGEEVLQELRKLYYDTAQTSNPIAMRALKDVVHTSQIVYGTDYWFRTAAETSRGLTTSKVFTKQELQMINRVNAERILPRFKGA